MEHPTKKLKRSESNGRRHLGSHSSSSSSRSQQQQSSSDSSKPFSITHQRYSLRSRNKSPKATARKSSNTTDPFEASSSTAPLTSSTSQQQQQQPSTVAATAASATGSKKRKQTGSGASSPRKRQRAPTTSTTKSPIRRRRKMDSDHAEELKRSDTVTRQRSSNRSSQQQQTTSKKAAEQGDASGKSRRKGKAKAADEDSSNQRPTATRRRAKKQADPEELGSHEPESDLERTPVSYFQYFEDDMEDDKDHTHGQHSADDDEYDHEHDWPHDAQDDDDAEGDDDDAEDMHEDIDEEEDDDDEELERIRRNFGLHLQSTFGGMMSDMSSRLRSILASLKNDEPTMQLVALQELAEILSVSSEENLAGYFASDSFVKELVRIMKGPAELLGAAGGDMDDDMMMALAMSEGLAGGNPEIALLACRCISNLLDAMPTAVTSVVYHGAIGVLCQKLKSIEYIDLAEQALCALEKVAQHLPRAVIHEGGLSAALMYFDFFSIHSQRTALRTAANCMRGVDTESFPQVMEVVPTLLNTISYADRTVVELTCLCWVKFAENYRNNSELLEKAISKDLLEKMMALIPVPGNTNVVRPSTFTDLLRIFRVISRGSPKLGFDLIQLNIIDSLYRVLTGAAKTPKDAVPTDVSLDNKWRDSVHSILRIFVDVLPSLPRDGMFSSKRFKETSLSPRGGASEATEEGSAKGKGAKSAPLDPRVELLESNPDMVKRIDQLCIPVLLEVYTSTVTLRTRQLVTHNLVKLIHFSNTDTLQQTLKDLPLSSFLAGILAQQEHSSLVIDALFQVELLLKKLPEVYRFLFEREGVLHEVEMLANAPSQDESQAEESVRNKQGEAESSEPAKDPDEPATALDVLRSMHESIREAQAAVEAEESSGDNEDEPEDSSKAAAAGSEASTSSDKKRKSSRQQQGKEEDEEDKERSETATPPPPRRRLFDRNDLHALLRSRFGATQTPAPEAEKGIGRGSTRRYIIHLAQTILREYQAHDREDSVSKSSSTLEEIKKCAQALKGTAADPCAHETLEKLISYLQGFKMGISSFELMNSGLMETLLAYLTDDKDETFQTSLDARRQMFSDMFLRREANMEADEIYPARVLVMRLQEVLSRSEPFEVVTPLESSSLGDNFRNPTSMLAKQLRLRLSGRGSDIPAEYHQLMVSTHAVATFKVLEEYLLARIGSMTGEASRKRGSKEGQSSAVHEDTEASEIEEIDVDTVDDDEEEQEETMEQQTQEPQAESSSKGKKASIESKPGKWVIRFYLDDTLISNDTTVYGAVHRYEMDNSRANTSMRNIWIMSYPVTFERVYVTDEAVASSSSEAIQAVRTRDNCERPSVLTDESVCSRALGLLRVLMDLARPLANDAYCTIPLQDFVNRKVAAKMNRQLEEPLIVASSCLPNWTYWLMLETPFLFPFETRYLFIQSTSFGYSRLIARWQSMQMRNNQQREDHHSQQPVLGRMERQKVRIMRSQMLESAIKILDLFGSSQSVLEIEYNGEEGTGLGPTLEFYAATSREFCKKSLSMWRDDEEKEEHEYVVAKHGLFPKPLAKSGNTKIVNLFKTLGQFMAKAMLDFRIIDLPFSAAFFKVAIGHEKPSIALITEIDPVLGNSIQRLQRYVDRKRAIYSDESKTTEQKLQAAGEIEVDGCRVEDLCLDFTLAGEASIELKTGGADIPVTICNVEEYIELLEDKIAGSGIAQQMNAFREGFDQLFALDDLKILTYGELVSLFGVSSEDWSYATLADAIKADHGFSMESFSFKNLLTILSEMTDDERREFLQFTTGSPRLPIGGWKALRPVFTVVCKTAESTLSPDDYLPSVMTCANYLKMPDYSSKEKMRTRLLTSMREGKNSFLLS